MFSVHERLALNNASFPHAGVFTATTASLVALWVASITVFGVVTVVVSWQNFKLKQKGMLGHSDNIEMNVSTCI